MMIVRLPDFKRGNIFKEVEIDKIQDRHHYSDINSFDKRLKAHKYELYGAESDNIDFEIHHVNKLKNLKGKTQRCKSGLVRGLCKPTLEIMQGGTYILYILIVETGSQFIYKIYRKVIRSIV